jgi:hypothetical protein
MKAYFKSTTIAFFSLLILCVASFGQTPVIRWSGQYPASPETDASYTPEDIIEVSDGIVICGHKTVQVGTNPSQQYVYIMKLDFDGDVIWENSYDFDNPVGGYESYEYAKSIIQNDQGNFFAVGYQSLPPFPVSLQPDRPQGRVLIMEAWPIPTVLQKPVAYENPLTTHMYLQVWELHMMLEVMGKIISCLENLPTPA